MNTTAALFKKEFHTAKWFLLGGILFFWSFPLLEGFGTYTRSGAIRTDMPSSMAVLFGGLFAIITAGGIVCLDMPKGLYEFWRSRPIRLLPYIAVKYLTGLSVILFVVTMPLLLEMYVMRNADSMVMASNQGSILYIHSCVIILIYSMAFFTGHILGNMTETVIISCAGLLLVYIVPVLVPALESLSFFNLLNNNMPDAQNRSQQLFFYIIRKFWIFVGVASVFSVVLIVGTWICLKRHVQFRFGLKALCWCQGILSLILFSAAAFSVGSNLNCLAKNPLLAGKEIPLLAYCFDDGDVVILRGQHNQNPTIHEYDLIQIDRIHEDSAYQYRCQTYMLDKSLTMLFFTGREIAWSKQTPDTVYFLAQDDSEAATRKFSLYVIKLDDSTHTARMLSELPVGEYGEKELTYYSDDLVLDHQTLYLLLPSEVVIFDVNNDKQPRLLTKSTYQAFYQGTKEGITIPLPSDKVSSEEQRYRIAQYVARRFGDWEGNRYARTEKDAIRIYEVKEVGPEKIQLIKIAERKTLPLEKLMEYSSRKTLLRKDMVYSLSSDSLSVYQLNESSETLKKIGHYAAPRSKFYDMFLREDGNIALVGIHQIHVVSPPGTNQN